MFETKAIFHAINSIVWLFSGENVFSYGKIHSPLISIPAPASEQEREGREGEGREKEADSGFGGAWGSLGA